MSVTRQNAAAAGEADGALGDLMKAIVQDRFGPPDTLRLVRAHRPGIGSGDVLLKVHAAAVNPYDWHMVRGDPRIARLMGGVGLTKPKTRIAGVDVAAGSRPSAPTSMACGPVMRSSGSPGEPSPNTPSPTPPSWSPNRPACHSNRRPRYRWRP